MKTIGLIGGMSWVSTLDYCRLLNEEVQRRLGGLHSARVILNSLDFAPLAQAQKTGDWDKIADVLTDAALTLETAGAELLPLFDSARLHVLKAVDLALGTV